MGLLNFGKAVLGCASRLRMGLLRGIGGGCIVGYRASNLAVLGVVAREGHDPDLLVGGR